MGVTQGSLDRPGPAGPAGQDGADSTVPGPQGEPGIDGADGADGLSAYEIAVADGFSGSEAEWLTSLVGPPGATGNDGQDGVDGRRVDAATLVTGSNGRVTFTFPSPFSVAPAVVASVNDTNTGDNVWYDTAIVSVSTTQAVVQVFRTQAVTVLGIAVLGSKNPAGSGRTVHVVAADLA